MSMTSTVNQGLRQQILNTLAGGIAVSNNYIACAVGGDVQPSLRTIQEATQKMTKSGLLVQQKIGRYTFYSILPEAEAYFNYYGFPGAKAATAAAGM
jgi:hypothetical protein